MVFTFLPVAQAFSSATVPMGAGESIGLVSFPTSAALGSGVEGGELALRLLFWGREGCIKDSG